MTHQPMSLFTTIAQQIAEQFDDVKRVAGPRGRLTTVTVSDTPTSTATTVTGEAIVLQLEHVEEDERFTPRPLVVRAPKVRHFLLLEFVPEGEGVAYTMDLTELARR